MKAWLKGGLILFFLMFSIYLYSLSYELQQSSFSEAIEREGIGMVLLPFIFMVLSFVYALSLYYTDKRLLQNEYSPKWLIKYNLGVFLILYLCAILFSILLVAYYVYGTSSEAEAGVLVILVALHGLWITPLATIIFSLIPSIVHKALKNKPRFLKILNIIVLLISSTIFIFAIISYSTCSFNSNDYCLSRKAVKNNDVGFCEKIDFDRAFNSCICWMVSLTKETTLCERIRPTTGGDILNKADCLKCVNYNITYIESIREAAK